MYGTVAFSIVLSVAIFIMLPYFIAGFLRNITSSEPVIAIAEAVVRIGIFLGYILLISRMKDIQRVFMYHGAEHKCINCVEHGMDLTVENVMNSPGNISAADQFPAVCHDSQYYLLPVHQSFSPWLRVVVRLLLVPVIAGVSYEIIRLAGRSDNKLVNLLSKPGMALQRLTTREPEADMVEVAIAAVEAVFDWKTYLNENYSEEVCREGQPE